MQSRMDEAELRARRKVTVSYTQSCLQPLQVIQPTFQQNIFIQPQKAFMDLGRIKLYFRPVVQMGQDGFPDLARKLFMGISFIDSENSIWACQSILINGSQLMSQSQLPLQYGARANLMGIYNQLTTKDARKTTTDYDFRSGIGYGGDLGSRTQGFNSVIANHPYSTGGGGATSKIEGIEQSINRTSGVPTSTGLYYPRAIVVREASINNDFIMPTIVGSAVADTGLMGSSHFASQVSALNDAYVKGSEGYVLGGFGSIVGQGVSPYGNLPLLPTMLTPSISVYLAQQQRFSYFRAKFLTQTVTDYHAPFIQGSLQNTTGVAGPTPNAVIGQEQQQVCVPIGSNSVNLSMGSLNPATTTIGSSGLRSQETATVIPTTAVVANSSSFVYQPAEDNTMCECELRKISLELDSLGEISLHNKQIQIQLQAQLPQVALSAFLQPSLFVGNVGGNTANPYPENNSTSLRDATSQGIYSTFLNNCVLGSATYQIQDLCVRLETIQYDDSAYEYALQEAEQSKPFLSARVQVDPCPVSQTGNLSIRQAIQNPIVNSFICCFVPTNRNKPSYQSINGNTFSPLPSVPDSLINFQGANPCTDARSTVYDSYYMKVTSSYVDSGDGKRYNANDPPLSVSAYTTWLQNKDSLQTALGRYIDGITYQEFAQNRFFFVFPFNVSADPSMAITSSQVVLNFSLDMTDRVNNSKFYQECNTSCANQFTVLTFALTVQSLQGDIVRI